MESPSLEIIKTYLDTIVCNLLQVNMLYLDGVGCISDKVTSRGPSQKVQFCESLTKSVLFNVE